MHAGQKAELEKKYYAPWIVLLAFPIPGHA